MLYRTTLDNITIVVDTDAAVPKLTIGGTDGAVIITAAQLGVIKLLRRAFSDMLDAKPETRGHA